MKKWIPILVVSLCAIWFLSTLRSPRETTFHASDFGRLPVVLNGRVQPMDSVARNVLLQIRNKQSVPTPEGRTLNASEWLLEVFFKPSQADERKIFRIDHPELLSLLRLPQEQKHFSYNDLGTNIMEIDHQAQRISSKDPQLQTVFEKQVMRTHNALNLYFRLKNSIIPEGATNFTGELQAYEQSIAPGVAALRAREDKKEHDEKAFNTFLQFVSRYEVLSRAGYPRVIPPVDPEGRASEWTTLGAALMESARQNRVPDLVRQYGAMATAFQENRPADFNAALSSLRQSMASNHSKEFSKSNSEFFYNHMQPFYRSIILYVLALVLAFCSWFNWSDWLRRSAHHITVLALIIHTMGLIYRMVLEGRPPVTNLYSSAVFIGWGAVVLGLIIERINRDGMGIVVAGTMGFVTLIIAHNLALGGDTMEMLRAVLDTNFWLATHVITITLGYASTFVAGLIAIVYVLRGVLTRTLTPSMSEGLERMVYGIICFATFFSFVGTVLGGIWADQSWGRFWGWDPKENGALIIVLWNAAILHARWSGMVKARGIMNMAIFGNIVTSFSWFGVNMLGIGLHAYGFMDGAFFWLKLFVVSQLVLIGLGLIPIRQWASFSTDTPPRTPDGKAAAKN